MAVSDSKLQAALSHFGTPNDINCKVVSINIPNSLIRYSFDRPITGVSSVSKDICLQNTGQLVV